MANTRECPSCASEVPADMDRCFICGYEFAGKPTRVNWRLWVVLLLLLLFLLPLVRLLIRALRVSSGSH